MIPRARLDAVTEADLQALIDHGVRESRTLDYKRDWPADRDARLELAKDVCAFANSLGGDLVFGMREEGGAAVEVVPLRLANLDAELLALTNALRDLLEPRVSGGLHPHPVPLASGGHAIVLRVAPSPGAPHRVTKDNHFYARTSVGKEPMDIHGIRNAFAANVSLAQQVLAFRDQALQRIVRHTGPAPELALPAFVCHVVPVSAMTRPDGHDVDALRAAAVKLQPASPSGHALERPIINLDGVVCMADRNADEMQTGYAQLYRDGCVELVDGDLFRSGYSQRENEEQPVVFPEIYERPLVRYGFRAIADTLATLGVPAPAYLMLSWVVASGTPIAVMRNRHHADFRPLPIHLTQLVAPPVYLEDFDVDPLTVLRPAFDVLWNAVGVAHTQTDFEAAN
ncbi:AlbA family DNA-binding domain-containing protein [Paraburkholderia caffeinilytica]|uniref:AlbA family DNA-binding domain-containing protein n=1 Tax=Paraburkholderia caffeinilytica TaxID=1761016 RepID=UPI003DA1604A